MLGAAESALICHANICVCKCFGMGLGWGCAGRKSGVGEVVLVGFRDGVAVGFSQGCVGDGFGRWWWMFKRLILSCVSI